MSQNGLGLELVHVRFRFCSRILFDYAFLFANDRPSSVPRPNAVALLKTLGKLGLETTNYKHRIQSPQPSISSP